MVARLAMAVLAILGLPLLPAAAQDEPPLPVEVRLGIANGSPIEAVVFSPDGRFILISTLHNEIKLWNTQTGEFIRGFHRHKGTVRVLAFAPDGKYFASGGTDKLVAIWRLDNGAPQSVLSELKGPVQALAFSPDGRLLAAGDDSSTFAVWDLENGGRAKVVESPSGAMAFRFDMEKNRLTVITKRAEIVTYDLQTMAEISIVDTAARRLSSVAFVPNSSLALLGAFEGVISLWDTATGKMVRSFAMSPAYNMWMAIYPDGKRALSSSLFVGHSLSLDAIEWNLETGAEERRIALNGTNPTLAPDGLSVATRYGRALLFEDLEGK